jgi:malonyl-CoA O-methyltransferase
MAPGKSGRILQKRILHSMNDDSPKLIARDVRRRLARAARYFDEADFVPRRSFDGLRDRLEPLLIEPERILDLGSATGTGSRQLAKSFRKASVISVDICRPMLTRARAKRPMFSRTREVQGDATKLPLRTGSIDLVLANMLLPWICDLPACFAEIARVLKQGGVFTFASLGPDSLASLADAWDGIDASNHVRSFPDMHIVGDSLVKAGFADPVLDVDKLAVSYSDTHALFRDLSATGAGNSLEGRRPTLTGKARFRAMQDKLTGPGEGGRLTVDLEIVYGHAWGTGPRLATREYLVEPGSISRQRRT